MKCDTCNNETDCDATLYLHNGTYYILAQYGSRFDMQRYALKRGQYEAGHVCDVCINKFITDGKASLVEDGVW